MAAEGPKIVRHEIEQAGDYDGCCVGGQVVEIQREQIGQQYLQAGADPASQRVLAEMQQQVLVGAMGAVAPGPETVPVKIVRGREEDREGKRDIQADRRRLDRGKNEFLAKIQYRQIDHHT